MATPASHNYIAVLIDEVDPSTRTVWAYDKTGQRIMAAWRETTGGVVRIPAQGENWTIERKGFQWHLDKKFSTADEHAIITTEMNPGDVHISGTNQNSTVNMQGQVKANGSTVSTIPITIAFS
jgi:hypothetical protein